MAGHVVHIRVSCERFHLQQWYLSFSILFRYLCPRQQCLIWKKLTTYSSADGENQYRRLRAIITAGFIPLIIVDCWWPAVTDENIFATISSTSSVDVLKPMAAAAIRRCPKRYHYRLSNRKIGSGDLVVAVRHTFSNHGFTVIALFGAIYWVWECRGIMGLSWRSSETSNRGGYWPSFRPRTITSLCPEAKGVWMIPAVNNVVVRFDEEDFVVVEDKSRWPSGYELHLSYVGSWVFISYTVCIFFFGFRYVYL